MNSTTASALGLLAMTVCAGVARAEAPNRMLHAVPTSPSFVHTTMKNFSVSGAGEAAGTEERFPPLGPSALRAVRWSITEGLRVLPMGPGFVESEATAISNNGAVVVGRAKRTDGRWVAVRWIGAGVGEELAGLAEELARVDPRIRTSSAVQVSETGKLIAGVFSSSNDPDVGRAFIWEQGQPVQWLFGTQSPSIFVIVLGVYERYGTTITGRMFTKQGEVPFRIADGGLDLLRLPEQLEVDRFRTYVATCSTAHSIAGFVMEGNHPARVFVWQERAGMRFIEPDLQGRTFEPRSVDAAGETVLGRFYGSGDTAAISRVPAAPTLLSESLRDSGVGRARAWTLSGVYGAAGEAVVGWGWAECPPFSRTWVFNPADDELVCGNVVGDDDLVDVDDLNAVTAGFGSDDPCLDLNADGVVNTRDLRLVLGQLGRRCR